MVLPTNEANQGLVGPLESHICLTADSLKGHIRPIGSIWRRNQADSGGNKREQTNKVWAHF